MNRSPAPKGLLVLALAASLAGALGALFLVQRNSVLSFTELDNPLDDRIDFNFPYRSFFDPAGNHYLIDTGKGSFRRILKLSPRGELLFVLRGGGREQEDLYKFSDLCTDAQQNLYVYNTVLGLAEGDKTKKQIKKFDAGGRYVATVLDGEAAGDVPYFQAAGNTLDYYDWNGPTLQRLDLKTGASTKVLNFDISTFVQAISGHEPGKIYFTDAYGKFFRVQAGGKIEDYPIENLKAWGTLNPYQLLVDDQGRLFINDLFSQSLIVVENGVARTYCDFSRLASLTPGGQALVTYCALQSNGLVSAVEKFSNTLYVFDPRTGALQAFDHAVLGGGERLKLALQWLLLLVSAVLAGAFLVQTYLLAFGGRFPLFLKYALVYGGFLAAALYLFSFFVFDLVMKNADEARENQYLAQAEVAGKSIDGALLEQINTLPDYFSAACKTLLEQTERLQGSSASRWQKDVSLTVFKKIGNNYYILDPNGVLFLYPVRLQDDYVKTLQDGTLRLVRFTDEHARWVAAVAPLRNAQNEITGLVEIASANKIHDELEANIRSLVLSRMALALGVFLLLLGGLTLMMTRSVKKLSRLARKVAAKDFAVRIDLRSRDEIGDLVASFNTMTRDLQQYDQENKAYAQHLEDLKNANERFVPVEFIRHLNKTSIIDVRLGDQVKGTMTVMFNDIRNFSTISEKMSPEENFGFINSYLRTFGPVVRQSGGFIDKYIGDCIMALYPASSDDAIRGAIGLKRTLKEYNRERAARGEAPIGIGIGLHTGELMLGIIGEAQRFEGSVISDAVNLASRLEGLTKNYRIQIIASRSTLESARDPAAFHARHIDDVQVKGRSETVTIYEIFDEDEPAQVALKLQTREALEEAIQVLRGGDAGAAKARFSALKALNPGDSVVDVYLERCENLLARRPAE